MKAADEIGARCEYKKNTFVLILWDLCSIHDNIEHYITLSACIYFKLYKNLIVFYTFYLHIFYIENKQLRYKFKIYGHDLKSFVK